MFLSFSLSLSLSFSLSLSLSLSLSPSDAVLLSRGNEGKRRGGALGLQMNIFERVTRVVKSYVNAAITAAEDPEK